MAKRLFKVKKSLGGAQTYRKWEDYEVGDTIIGTFIGIHVCQYKKENFKIKVLDAQLKDADLGETLIGKTLVMNACGSLSKQMEEVQEGDTIQVEYGGTIELQKGPYAGKDAHQVAVAIVDVETEEEDGL